MIKKEFNYIHDCLNLFYFKGQRQLNLLLENFKVIEF
jgi:hypothetical protein